MHEDDVAFEAHIALMLAKLESITLPQDNMVRAYAFAWMAAHSAGDRMTFAEIAAEVGDNLPWDLVTPPKSTSA